MLTPLKQTDIARRAIKQFLATNKEELIDMACDIYIQDVMKSGQRCQYSEKYSKADLLRNQISMELDFLNKNYK